MLQIKGGRWCRHAYDWGDSGALLKGAVKYSAKLSVGAVAGCCTHRLNSHCSSRRCGRAPAAPPLK